MQMTDFLTETRTEEMVLLFEAEEKELLTENSASSENI